MYEYHPSPQGVEGIVSNSSSCSINSLPSETLTEIFIWGTHRIVRMKANDSLIRLCHVCSLWRTVALCTPALWKKFLLFITPRSISWVMKPLEMFLRLSGTQPLTIFVETHKFDDTAQSMMALAPFMDALVAHSCRWHYMYFLLHFRMTAEILFRAGTVESLNQLALSSKAPSLQQAGMDGAGPEVGDEEPEVGLRSVLLSRYPRLETLDTRGLEISVEGCRSPLTLLKLTYVGRLQPVLEIMTRSPALTRLKFTTEYSLGDDDGPLQTITQRANLSCLKEISLVVNANIPFYENIHVPALERLQHVEHGPMALPTVNAMLSRCRPPLKRFTYLGFYYGRQMRDLLTLFHNAPYLTELLFYTAVQRELFDALVWTGSNRVLPLLESIMFYDVEGQSICASVQAFVSSRVFEKDSKLKTLGFPKLIVDDLRRYPGTETIFETGFQYEETVYQGLS